ncbi:MAG: hypothetical protein ABUL72_06745, partial [Armatimonadota bacterium]
MKMVSSEIPDSTLQLIAESDGYEIPENFAALQRLRSGQSLDEVMEWVPSEVLNLWSHARHDKRLAEREFWISHAFCKSALIRVPGSGGGAYGYNWGGEDGVLTAGLFLGEPYADALVKLYVSILEDEEASIGEYAYHALALAILLTLGESTATTTEREQIQTWAVSVFDYGERVTESYRAEQGVRIQKVIWYDPDPEKRVVEEIRHEPSKDVQNLYYVFKPKRPGWISLCKRARNAANEGEEFTNLLDWL